MLKVMQVMTDTNIGGAGIWLLNFLKNYDRTSLDVVVVIPRNSALRERIEEQKVRYIEADSIADVSFSKSGIGVLRKIMAEEKPQVVHSHASLSARIAAKLEKIPVVNTRHCLEPAKTGAKKLIYGALNRMLSDVAVAVSMAVFDNLLQDGIPKNRVRLVYNGVPSLKKLSDEKRSALRQELGYEDCFVFGMFARLEPVKNHKLLIEATKRVVEENRKIRVAIVGDGSEREALQKLVREAGLDEYVRFFGYMSDVSEMMNVCDANVLTSDREALSISLVEGMTLGKPCITTDAGGTREVVENHRCGEVVPVGDAEALFEAMLRFSENPDLCLRYGAEGEMIAAERFSPQFMCQKLEEIYTECGRNGETTF